MYMFMFEEMLYHHVKDEKALEKVASKEVNNPYRIVFENLLLGQNLTSTKVINDIAIYISKLSEEEIKKITYEDVVKEVGCFVDTSGCLV